MVQTRIWDTFGQALGFNAGRPRCRGLGWQGVTVLVLLLRAGSAFGQLEFEREPILYNSTPLNDCVTDLQRRINGRQVTLAHDDKHGYLPALLKEFKIPVSSQMLVFRRPVSSCGGFLRTVRGRCTSATTRTSVGSRTATSWRFPPSIHNKARSSTP